LEDEDILTELDISDDHENEHVRLLMHQTTEPELYVYDGNDTGVTIDFNKFVIHLKKVNLPFSLLCCHSSKHSYLLH